MTSELEQLITDSNIFITDLEEISDCIYNSEQIFLYDTGAISNHEGVFFKGGQDLLGRFVTANDPILITDVTAAEMRILEDTNKRYLNYLSKFHKIIFLKEEDFFSLIELDYKSSVARGKFLAASKIAFSDILPLKQDIEIIGKKHFPISDSRIFNRYDDFCQTYSNSNRGELSLLLLSCILGITAPNTRITFLSMDNDLYSYVTRCYLKDPFNHLKNREISIASDDTLIQGTYFQDPSIHLDLYIDPYRHPERKVIYFDRIKGIKSYKSKREKLSNQLIKDLILKNQIEIEY
ncbi:hypothetical protein [Domibacillus robiginosus]|uniref:hypothetical protein n=1 Tax=Domibacillus robiginosus TaxID=1071054 RepID=UPI00067B4ADA|nr:hypothetical protein [Domibacillus robiginosus]